MYCHGLHTPVLPLCRPGVPKGKAKEGKGPLGKHPISQAPKLDANLNKPAAAADEASDASDDDSAGEPADDSSHAGAHAAPHQGVSSSWRCIGNQSSSTHFQHLDHETKCHIT